jgi:hypothetical protein
LLLLLALQNDEIEIDIAALDTATLRELERYVKSCLTTRRSKKKAQPVQQLQRAREEAALSAQREQQMQAELSSLNSGGGLGAGLDDHVDLFSHSAAETAEIAVGGLGLDMSAPAPEEEVAAENLGAGLGADSSDSDSDDDDAPAQPVNPQVNTN